MWRSVTFERHVCISVHVTGQQVWYTGLGRDCIRQKNKLVERNVEKEAFVCEGVSEYSEWELGNASL